MKLGNIFESREAWQHLVGLKLPPHTAYRLMKYHRRVNNENEVIEQHRVKSIRDLGKTDENGEVTLQRGTPEFHRFAAEFGEFLNTDSDLKPLDMTITFLLDLLEKEQGNILSVQDLSKLEIFFQAEAS